MLTKLCYNKKSDDPIYYIQIGVRIGAKTTTKTVRRIGKHSELLKITDDPLAYAMEEVRKENEKAKENKISITQNIDFNAKVSHSADITPSSTSRNIGYFYLQYVYQKLELDTFFDRITADRKMEFDCNEINRFLTYGRILDPSSKLSFFNGLSDYYEQPKFQYHQILRFMTLLQEHSDEYLEHLFMKSNKIVERDTSVCFFDCTNVYFEIESEDEDYYDEVTGKLVRGFRKYGPSKEHRPNPLAEIGLFMDGKGIPLSMVVDSGSTSEQLLAVPGEKHLLKMFKKKEFIYCADAGLGSSTIRLYNSLGGRSFIVTQSIKKLSAVLKERVFEDKDYRLVSTGTGTTLEFMKTFDKKDEKNLVYYEDRAFKVITTDSLVDLGLDEWVTTKSGKKVKRKAKAKLEQCVIITYSRKYREYQKYVRDRQVERARKLLEKKDPEAIKNRPNDIRRFIKRVVKDEKSKDDTFVLNTDQIAEEEKYDGFYAIATNLDVLDENGKPILKEIVRIIQIMAQRYLIEECFRILKTYFDLRPIFHQKEERIKAHFLICYTGLLVFRLLEALLDDKGTHYTIEQIIDTLNNLKVANVGDMYYMALYNGCELLNSLESITGLSLDKKYYHPPTLNKIIRKLR